MGYQLQEVHYYGGATSVGTHPTVYKTRWGARLALIFEGGWFFGESWRVVPVGVS